MDWDAMNRLHQRDLISDPATKAKSVVLTENGLREAQRLCRLLFGCAANTATMSVRYGNSIVNAESADGVAGILCRDATTGQHFFRVSERSGMFMDYDLRHDELAITIAPDALAAFYRDEGMQVLDHSPSVLGLESIRPGTSIGA